MKNSIVLNRKLLASLSVSAIFMGTILATNASAELYPPKAYAVVNGNTVSDPIGAAYNTKATNLRLELNTLLREHAAVGAVTLSALYKGEDTTRLMQLMKDNENLLGNLIQDNYDKNTRDSFVKLWDQHMMEYQKYTNAKKNNDSDAVDAAKNNLMTISEKIGKLFDDAGKNLSASTVSSLMKEHVNGTLDIVDAVDAGNETKKADLMKKAYDQAGKMADTLAKGIIQDNPDIYNK